jgi:hypothetical protein
MLSDLNVGYVTVSTDGARVADRALLESHFTFLQGCKRSLFVDPCDWTSKYFLTDVRSRKSNHPGTTYLYTNS